MSPETRTIRVESVLFFSRRAGFAAVAFTAASLPLAALASTPQGAVPGVVLPNSVEKGPPRVQSAGIPPSGSSAGATPVDTDANGASKRGIGEPKPPEEETETGWFTPATSERFHDALALLFQASPEGGLFHGLTMSSSSSVSYVDLNPYVRTYCDTLGVEIGSAYFLAWGCEIYPGQTGGQADFGWRQDHKIPKVGTPEFDVAANGILANAGYRPIFYLDTFDAKRKGYGRPWTWIPDPVIDEPLTESWFAPNGVMVTGHDMQHFSLKFLAALAAKPTPNEKSQMAKAFLWRYASVVGGWLRTDWCKTGYYSSREVGRVLDFVCDVANVGYMDMADAQAILDWVEYVVLPQIPANGMGYIYKPTDQGYKTEPNLGDVPYSYPWQDGLMVPGMERFGVLLENHGNKQQKRLGSELRAKARLIAKHMASVITDDGACPKAEGIDGQLSWVENEKYGYSVWCYRALRIAGAHAKADVVFNKYKNDSYWWPWFVEPDGKWNKALPMAQLEQ